MAIAVAPQCKLAGKESDSVISYAALNRSSFRMFDQVSASNHVECFYGHPPVRQPPSGYKIASFPYVACNFKGKFCVNASRSPDETADEKGNIKNDDQQLHSTEPNLQSCKEDSELEASHFRLIENEKHGYSDGEIQKQRKKSELEEIGESIVQFMRPFIKFLNGSSLNQLNREGLPSRRNNILLTFSNAFVRTVSGLAWTDSRQYEIGNMFRKAEADFFKASHGMHKWQQNDGSLDNKILELKIRKGETYKKNFKSEDKDKYISVCPYVRRGFFKEAQQRSRTTIHSLQEAVRMEIVRAPHSVRCEKFKSLGLN